MTERSQFWTTGTTGDGTTTITEAQAIEWFRDTTTPFASAGPHTSQGVLAGVLNELAVSGVSSPVAVATGAAAVEGYYYKNDAAVNVAIPTPAGSTRIDRIVLRASHSTTRTVRITRIAGTEGAGAPAITQTAGTTWDIPLAQVSITTGGVITVTDERSFCHFATRLDRARIDGGTAARVPFFDSNGRLTDESGFTYDTSGKRVRAQGGAAGYWIDETDGPTKGALIVLDGGVLQFQRRATAFGAFEATPFQFDMVNGQATISPTAASAPIVLGANGQGQRVAGLVAEPVGTLGLARQGGSATAWATQGNTNQSITANNGARIECGVKRVSWTGTATGSATVTFPTAFSNTPIVYLAMQEPTGTGGDIIMPNASSITTTGFTITAQAASGPGTFTYDVSWLAVGPQ